MDFVANLTVSTIAGAGGSGSFIANQTATQLVCGLSYRNFVPPAGGE